MAAGAADDALIVYYCANCGTYAFVLGAPLESQPQRSSSDGAFAVDETLVRSNRMAHGSAKRIRRAHGVEQQYRFNCEQCGLFLAYRPKKPGHPTQYLYVLPRFVTSDLAAALRRAAVKKRTPASLTAPDDGSVRIVIKTEANHTISKLLSFTDECLLVGLAAPRQEAKLNAELLRYAGALFDIPETRLSLEWNGKNLVLVVDGVTLSAASNAIFKELPDDATKTDA